MHDVIEDSEVVELDTVQTTNGTTVKQSSSVSGSDEVTDTSSWSDTQKLVVHAQGDFSIPVVGELGIEVTDTSTIVQDGSTEREQEFSWEQPVVVPAESTVIATILVTRSTLTLPYTLIGSYEYDSGANVAGKLGGGTYHGVNSHRLRVKLTQVDLDGNRAANPAAQPPPLLRQRST